MPRFNIAAATLAIVAWVLAPEAAAQSCVSANARFQAKMGSGYKVSAIATGITGARHIVVDKAGNLLVATSGGAVRRLVIKDNGDTVCVVSSAAISGAQGVCSVPHESPLRRLTNTRTVDQPRNRHQRRWQDSLHQQPRECDGIPLRRSGRHCRDRKGHHQRHVQHGHPSDACHSRFQVEPRHHTCCSWIQQQH